MTNGQQHEPLRAPWLRLASASLLAALIGAPAVFAQAEDSEEKKRARRLRELVVSASGFEQEKKEAPASITVLTSDDILKTRNNSLAELLSNVEGIDVGGNVGKTGGLNISIRGMSADYTLVLVDGRRQNAAGNVTPNGFGETSSSFLPPLSAIERVEVIRGPMATLYGSDAMGGVINIITKRVGQRWTGSLVTDGTMHQRAGFGGSYSTSLNVNGPLVANVLGLALRGRYFHRNESNLKPSGEYDENTAISKRGPSPVGADIYSIGGKLSWNIVRRHSAWLDFDIARQTYDNREAQLGTLDDSAAGRFQGYGPEQKFNREQYALGHAMRFSRGVWESSFMMNRTETIGRTLPSGTPGGPPGSGAPDKPAGAPRTLKATNNVFDSKLTSTFASHVFTVGGQIWDAKMIDAVAVEPFTHTQWSIFLEDEWRFATPLALTVGVRHDDHNKFGGQTSPRAYLVWNATSNWTFKGGISQGYKTPRVEQLMEGIIGFTRQGRNATIGSPHLKPETSTTTEIGAYFSNPLGYSASVSLFNNNFKDKIASGTPIPNCTFEGAPDLPGCANYGNFPEQETFNQSINIDKAVTQGAEGSFRVPFGDRYSLLTNYTFTQSEQKSGNSKGMPLSNTPKHMVNMNFRAQFTERIGSWIRGEYRSKRARRTSSGTNAAYEALGDYKAYELFHIGGSYRVVQNVTLNATIYNLLNKDFLKYAAYQGTPTSSNPTGIQYTSLYNNHQEGRRLWLSTTLEF